MADEQQESCAAKRNLKPASENIWYVMATIAGELDGKTDIESIRKSWGILPENRYYWNGYIRSLLSEEEYKALVDADGNKIELPELNDGDKDKIRTTLDSRGFQGQVPDLYKIDFRDVEFPYINLSQFVFVWTTNFQGATFTQEANFEKATFVEGASFRRSTFTQVTYFDGVTFTQGADFKKTTFMQWVRFARTTFKKSTDFSDAVFTGLASFGAASFMDTAHFFDATFKKHAYFIEATFTAGVIFQGAIFAGIVSFRATTFQTCLVCREVKFEKHPPEFFDAKIPEDITWTDAVFPKAKDLTSYGGDVHKDAYERLALMMDRLKKHHDQHRFFRLEMRVRRQMERNPFLKTMNGAYALFSDYGYGFGRAALWWGSNITIGAALLIPRKGLRFDFSWSGLGEFFELFGTALITSFSNAHGFLGLGRIPLKDTIANYQNTELLIPFNAIATAQTIIGVFLLFFLILTARNRFRMG